MERKELAQRFYKLWEKLEFTCYGTGEEDFIDDLRRAFKGFEFRNDNWHYDYQKVGIAVNNTSLGWCILNLLNNAGFIDYGTSLRYGWTTEEGTQFVEAVLNNETEELYDIVMMDIDEKIECGVIVAEKVDIKLPQYQWIGPKPIIDYYKEFEKAYGKEYAENFRKDCMELQIKIIEDKYGTIPGTQEEKIQWLKDNAKVVTK